MNKTKITNVAFFKQTTSYKIPPYELQGTSPVWVLYGRGYSGYCTPLSSGDMSHSRELPASVSLEDRAPHPHDYSCLLQWAVICLHPLAETTSDG